MILRSRRGGAVVTALLAGLSIAGCARGGEAPSRPGPKLAGFEEVTSTENRLPAGFPKNLPLPRYRRVLYSATSNLGLSAYFEAGESPETMKRFLLKELPEAGWALRSCHDLARSPDPAVTIITAGKDEGTVTVTVGYHPDYAARLNGGRYDFFVSLAFRSQTQSLGTTPTGCSQ